MAGHRHVPKPRVPSPARNGAPGHALIGLVESAWLFTRGAQSVRLVRVRGRQAGRRLLVQGPGASHVVHEFDDAMACAIHQSEIERQLVAKRFRLRRFGPAPPPRPDDLLAS